MKVESLKLKKNLHILAGFDHEAQLTDRDKWCAAGIDSEDYYQKVRSSIGMIFQATGAFPVVGDSLDADEHYNQVVVVSRTFLTYQPEEGHSKGAVYVLFMYNVKYETLQVLPPASPA